MSERRLAAIMFTDIVGYTALMGSDEERAFEVLKKNREIHTRLIEAYNGKLIKEMGDGMLVIFNIASDAVRCAVEIQKACKEAGIPLKIGIHEGEIVFSDEDVLGDGVNIASRLEAATRKGCITISEAVYWDIKNKTDIRSRYAGAKSYKNVAEPVKVYEISCEEYPSETGSPGRLKKVVGQWQSFVVHNIIKISMGAIPVLAAVFLVVFLFYRGRSVPFNERDWIVISDFENTTSDSLFDHSLNTAFALSINQSRYINVFTRQRMQETLKRMEKTGLDKINEKTAREIAERDGVKFCIIPGISKIGDQYILTAKIEDAGTGNIYNSEVLYVKSREEILEKLDELSKRVRRHLGETRYEIYGQSRPLKEVTTSSLEALKQYSLGIDCNVKMEFEEAAAHYRNAINLDPGFVSAKASLGNLLFEKFDRDEGREWLDQAIRSIDKLTDREKYAILAFYAVNVENDLNKGIEYTKMLIDLYPDDPVPHNNLGWYYQQQEHYKKAVEEYKKALQVDPYMIITYSGVVWVYLSKLGGLDSSYVWSKRMIRHGPDNPWGYFYLGSVYVALDSLEKAEKAFHRAKELNPGLLLSQYRLAHVYRLLGRYDKAVEVLKDIFRINPGESSVYYDMGVNYQLMGDRESATGKFLQFKKIAESWKEEFPENPETYVALGTVLTRLGEKRAGWEIGKRAMELDSTSHFSFAELLAILGRTDEAVGQLEKALESGYRDLAWIKLHPDLQALQTDPRFQRLIRKYFHLP